MTLKCPHDTTMFSGLCIDRISHDNRLFGRRHIRSAPGIGLVTALRTRLCLTDHL